MAKEKTSNNEKIVKKRHWAFVLYPESAPENWRDQLQQKGVLAAISPLHDRDINPTGEPKKPHYHVILSYAGPTAFSVIKGITDSLGQPIPQALEQVRGYYRYLTHMDNPEKAQYDAADIQHLNGFNIFDFSEMTKSEVTQIIKQLQQFIRDHNVMEYCHFMDLLADNDLNTEYEVASSHTFFFNAYIKSRRHSFRKEESYGQKDRANADDTTC